MANQIIKRLYKNKYLVLTIIILLIIILFYTVDELNWDPKGVIFQFNIDDLSNPFRVDKSSLMPHNLII